MNLNLTLLGQMLTFAILVTFTMRYIWPPLMKAIANRQEKIAEGLAAADRGKHELEVAHHKANEIIRDAKLTAAQHVEKAAKRAAIMVEEAKEQARKEADRMLVLARDEIIIERVAARESLRQEVASIALLSAQKILGAEINPVIDEALIQSFIQEVEHGQ